MPVLFFCLGVLAALYDALLVYVYIRDFNRGLLDWLDAVVTLVSVLVVALISFSLFYAADRWSKTKPRKAAENGSAADKGPEVERP
jgi:hypothetical protein